MAAVPIPTVGYSVELQLLSPQWFGNGHAPYPHPQPNLHQLIYHRATGPTIADFKHRIDDHMNVLYRALDASTVLSGITTFRNAHAPWIKDGVNPNTNIAMSLWKMFRGNDDVRASRQIKLNLQYPFYTGFHLGTPILDANDRTTFADVAQTIRNVEGIVDLETLNTNQFNVKVFPGRGNTGFGLENLKKIAAVIYVFRAELDKFYEPFRAEGSDPGYCRVKGPNNWQLDNSGISLTDLYALTTPAQIWDWFQQGVAGNRNEEVCYNFLHAMPGNGGTPYYVEFRGMDSTTDHDTLKFWPQVCCAIVEYALNTPMATLKVELARINKDKGRTFWYPGESLHHERLLIFLRLFSFDNSNALLPLYTWALARVRHTENSGSVRCPADPVPNNVGNWWAPLDQGPP